MSTMTLSEDRVQAIATARALKAAKIADALRAVGCDAATAARLDDRGRRAAEAAAGTRRASDDTWRVTVEMLADSARSRALCPYCGMGDPEAPVGPRKHEGHNGPCSR